MDLQTRFITKDEFKEYTGIDLEETLAGSTDTPESLINRTTIRLESFLNSHYFQRVDLKYPTFSDYQKAHYKYALIEQILYIIKNGDISVDSGYNPENGQVVNSGTLKEITLAPNTQSFLMECGLLSRKIRTSPYSGIFWW